MKKRKQSGAVPAGLPAELHISGRARRKYGFDRRLFGTDGRLLFADQDAIRELVERVNRVRRSAPETQVGAGALNAVGLLDEIWHYVYRRFRRAKSPGLSAALERHLSRRLTPAGLEAVREGFLREFPPPGLEEGKEAQDRYLRGRTGRELNRRLVLEEILLLGLANRNPAFSPFAEFFDDSGLEKIPGYRDLIEGYRELFRRLPTFGPNGNDLFAFLVEPIVASPHSLFGQLEYVYRNWGELLSEELRSQLLLAGDLIREEEKARSPGTGLSEEEEREAALARAEVGLPRWYPDDYEAFSPDLDWMPRVVMMVKNASVWFEQLSRRYGRTIARLDQIPDRELDDLRDWGITALWLIGIWRTCHASRRIKQKAGSPEAGASAYSLYDYRIAPEFGGEGALDSLRERANRRGIRLASDMVPNHTGIYSRWIVEHPDWFVQLPAPPFPGYRFTGPDLSNDPRVAVFIEDGYWTRSDAAVVFKRLDRLTGEVRYIYHGNDGTNMPWNDTAQLDYLKKQVREAVIDTILEVARRFPIIRFDAAMVLTKKHFQRLWYPPPGSGGDIPSRAGRGLSPARFNRLFPREFWREVVDRVARRRPETLLLAEAFWLLEGYFVRTLGMHRVYNSAFMNMLKMEVNSQYREMLKEFLEFEPQILKRFVNFMSNPDEATAAEGFGDGDKYFGVCSMMATLPGLPLFAHGQVEGLREKYGMEFLRPRQVEPINRGLIERHRREIFPLLKKRYLFSDVANFVLYDFYRDQGDVDENVYAYSNRYRGERAIFAYHNFYAETAGWIRVAAARVEKKGGSSKLLRPDLVEALSLRSGPRDFTLFKELRSSLEYIISSRDLKERGLHLELGPYEVKVFTDFRVIRDGPEGNLAALAANLDGKGVCRLDEEVRKIHFGRLHRAFRELFNPRQVSFLLGLAGSAAGEEELNFYLKTSWTPRLEEFLDRSAEYAGRESDPTASAAIQAAVSRILLLFVDNPELPAWTSSRYSRPALRRLRDLPRRGRTPEVPLAILLLWLVLAEATRRRPGGAIEVSRMKKWYLDELLIEFFESLGLEWHESRDRLDLVQSLIWGASILGRIRTKNHLCLLADFFRDDTVRRYLRYNWYEDILWLNRESLETLLFWIFAAGQLNRDALRDVSAAPRVRGLVLLRAADRLCSLAETASWRVDGFLEQLSACRPPARRRRVKAKKAKPSRRSVRKKSRAGPGKAGKGR